MKPVMIATVVALVALVGCSDPVDSTSLQSAAPEPSVVAETTPVPSVPAPEPQAYVPAGQPGSSEAYAEMVERLEQFVPVDLRREVPWPDLRNPNPIVAQVEIFELWIWMTANLPEPRLVEVISAPGSPSRDQVISVFGRIDADGVFERRTGEPYRAFDHRVVTFESAGLPMWLARDVPDDAVVVYYSDSSGPVDVLDRETGARVNTYPAVPVRTWLSIMVPTDVGWQLWRDQLIEPNDAELQVPDVPPPPGAESQPRRPEL